MVKPRKTRKETAALYFLVLRVFRGYSTHQTVNGKRFGIEVPVCDLDGVFGLGVQAKNSFGVFLLRFDDVRFEAR